MSYSLYFTVEDPGEWPRRPAPPLFLDQTEARRAEIIFWETAPPPTYLRVWMTGPSLSQGVDPALLQQVYSCLEAQGT